MQNNKKNPETFDEKVQKSEMRQKRITRIVCLFLAALMVLGGTAGIIITTIMS